MISRHCFGVAAGLLSLMAVSTSSYAAQPGCYIFEQEEWEGRARYLQPNTKFDRLDAFRDNVRSVMVTPACRIEAFEREDFNGPKKEFDDDRKRLGSWADKIESLRCVCE